MDNEELRGVYADRHLGPFEPHKIEAPVSSDSSSGNIIIDARSSIREVDTFGRPAADTHSSKTSQPRVSRGIPGRHAHFNV